MAEINPTSSLAVGTFAKTSPSTLKPFGGQAGFGEGVTRTFAFFFFFFTTAFLVAVGFAEALAVDDAPTVIRFPKGSVGTDIDAVRRCSDGVDVLLEAAHKDVLIVAIGSFAQLGLEVAARLAQQGIGATVVDPRWVVPVPTSIIEMARDHRLVITLEDGVRVGGIGTRIRQDLRSAGVDTAVDELGLPDEFIDHATREEILAEAGLTAQVIARDVVAQVLGSKIPVARPLPEESNVADSLRAE